MGQGKGATQTVAENRFNQASILTYMGLRGHQSLKRRRAPKESAAEFKQKLGDLGERLGWFIILARSRNAKPAPGLRSLGFLATSPS